MEDFEYSMEATILGAVAAGWTHPETEDRVLDAALATAIAAEVIAVLPVIFLNNGLELDITTGEVTRANQG